jgi:Mn2+/Fe2+ NRAMP family transporter
MVGTSIAPWMQFYLQSAVVEKGITAKEYVQSRLEVIIGCIMTDVVAFFIIVACAGAIWAHGPKDIDTPPMPRWPSNLSVKYAFLLFSAGLVQRLVFRGVHSAAVDGYTVCEGLGFESGVDKRFQAKRPIFYWLYTLLIVLGAGVILIPGFPGENGPVFAGDQWSAAAVRVLIYMILLINKKGLMKEWTNSPFYNAISWASVAIMIGLTLALGSSAPGNLRTDSGR